MIDVGLRRNDYGSIPATAIRRGLKPLDARTNSRTTLVGPVGWILAVKQKNASLLFLKSRFNYSYELFENLSKKTKSLTKRRVFGLKLLIYFSK